MEQVKDKIQRYGLNCWWANAGIGTLEWATGVGKTRAGVLAVAHVVNVIKDAKVLILAPTRDIRDRVWQREFKKWGYESIYATNVQVECIQTAYKLSGMKYDLVIVDELHNALSSEYIKFFYNNSYTYLLGLSATISIQKKEMQQSLCPTVHKITVEQALEYNLVSSFCVINLSVSLSKEERRLVNSYTKTIDELQEKGVTAFGLISKRSTILHNAIQNRLIVKDIADLFPNDYGLVFASFQKEVELLSDLLGERSLYYHGGMSEKQLNLTMKSFENPDSPVNILVSAKKLNEGADLSNVSFAIVLSGTSSGLVQTQRLGRIIRRSKDKFAVFIRVYVKDTKDEAWLRQSQYDSNSTLIKNVDSIEELKEVLESFK
jgi:superfamily II DNA or RNA helicase